MYVPAPPSMEYVNLTQNFALYYRVTGQRQISLSHSYQFIKTSHHVMYAEVILVPHYVSETRLWSVKK